MKRRRLKLFISALAVTMVITSFPASASVKGRLTDYTLPENAMYNGIVLPEGYEFSHDMTDSAVDTPPYLIESARGGYAPEVINIDVGRQLFVDDFLIENTNLARTYYSAVKSENNPILTPEKEWELKGGDRDAPSVGATSGGLWYDMEDKIYKMWYEAAWNGQLAYATSTDGINWERPALNSDGSNTMIHNRPTDSFVVWIDYDAPAAEKYKLSIRSGGVLGSAAQFPELYVSSTGTEWTSIGLAGPCDDRTTFFYNPFTKKWVFSIRASATKLGHPFYWNGESTGGRYRKYHDGDTFYEAAQWSAADEPIDWLTPDDADFNDPTVYPQPHNPQIYNFDSIAYESLMIGMFEMWYGPDNQYINQTGWPKICDLQAAFSRDGFHYDRPNRKAFINAERTQGAWDYGYLSPMGGGMIVYDNEIRIYYSGYSGYWYVDGKKVQNAYAGGCIGYATLRRDGFASMNGTGNLTTKTLTVTKDVKHLFVNANASIDPDSFVRAELLDMQGNVIEGYSVYDSIPLTDNTAKAMLSWNGGNDISMLQGKAFKIKFYLYESELYSFWLAPDEHGESGGELAAGYIGVETPLPEQEEAYTTYPETSGNQNTPQDGSLGVTDTTASGKGNAAPIVTAGLVGAVVGGCTTAAGMLLYGRRKKKSTNE